MYIQLELQYNNYGLTQIENKLQEEKRHLQKLFYETRKEAQVRAN